MQPRAPTDLPGLVAENSDDQRQLQFLEESAADGAARYAAAMYFFMRGKLSAEQLEHFRVVCKDPAPAERASS